MQSKESPLKILLPKTQRFTALFIITTKRRKICNGIVIEPGMKVQVASIYNNPVVANRGQEVEDAFMRLFGISLRKANALNMSDLDVKKTTNN